MRDMRAEEIDHILYQIGLESEDPGNWIVLKSRLRQRRHIKDMD